ncbi:MAG: hypothetical protein ACREDT_03250 [Methylocella sp.]
MRDDIRHALAEPWVALPKKVGLYGFVWLVGAIVLTGLKILTEPNANFGGMKHIFGELGDVIAGVAFFSGFVSIMIYYVWWVVGKLYEGWYKKNIRYLDLGED